MDSLQILIPGLYDDMVSFYHSSFFVFVKFFLAIYLAVLFIDVILLLIKKSVSGSFRQGAYGVNIPRDLITKKNKTKAKWEKIKERLRNNREEEYKLAIIEADNLIDGIIKKMHFSGENFGERLNNIPENRLDNIGELKEAHAVANRIILDEKFEVTKEIAEEVLGKYDHFLTFYEA